MSSCLWLDSLHFLLQARRFKHGNIEFERNLKYLSLTFKALESNSYDAF